jgi:alpha-N-arabinofuranosidase
MAIRDQDSFSAANPHYLRLTADAAGFGVANEGFRGIGVRAGAAYRFSTQARAVGGSLKSLQVALVGAGGQTLAEGTLKGLGPEWQAHSLTLKAKDTEAKARLVITAAGAGTVDLDMVSLFPKDTWAGRPNGLRKDLVQLLADLKPGFLRFPGGCIVEGHTLDNRYQWKTTLGRLEQRKLIRNRWNDEFKHRPTPDYYQSFGLGYFEFFQLCADLGAAPLPIMNCGMACQFNSKQTVPVTELQPYLQDVLDLIEFANGPPSSPWGRQRAALGHPKPFGLKHVGIGNEQWGTGFLERYAVFHRVLKEKHPEIALVSSAGPSPANDDFKLAWRELSKLGADIIDEHCYDRPAWFFDAATRYDRYDRTGPKVFMGEYAVQSVATCSPENRSTWECALAEAAFLTGLERNADVVQMSAYAPLLAHLDGWQWKPDLIWFDNLRAAGTVSYQVQKIFSRNRPDTVLPMTLSQPDGIQGLRGPAVYAVAGLDRRAGEVVVKAVNASARELPVRLALKGARQIKPRATAQVLAAALDAEADLEQPNRVVPQTVPVRAAAEFTLSLPAHSVTVLRVKARL